ncbi:MAG: DsbE family thiol:disulfide interchange protein [Rhodobacteraceae bacterium]|nr:DsbE family thiol:disulfide interchange protein [Paracoccaceae bacterium]
MAKISPLMLVPPVLFIALAAMFAIGMYRDDPDALPSVFIGRQAPPVAGEALPGIAALADADLRTGELTIVNFWASWCPPCRAEHPTLMALAAEGYRVVGVNMLDKTDAALGFLAEGGNPFAAISFDPRGRVRIDWGVTGPPETFIVSGDGTVLFKFIGPLVGSDYVQRFLPELEKAAAK